MKSTQKGRTERMMKNAEFTNKKKAESFYRKHPRATRIQRMTDSGLTAGTFQPGVPKTIRHRGKTLQRTYAGPHDTRTAESLAKSLRASGLNSKSHKTKRGHFVYAE